MNTLQLLYFANTPNDTNCYSCVYFTYFCCNTGASGTHKQFPLGLSSPKSFNTFLDPLHCRSLLFHFNSQSWGGGEPPHWFKCSLTFWSKLPFTEPSMLPPWLPASRWQLKQSRTVALSVQQFGIQKKEKKKIGVLIFWRRAQEKARLQSWPIELPSVIRVTRQIFCE